MKKWKTKSAALEKLEKMVANDELQLMKKLAEEKILDGFYKTVTDFSTHDFSNPPVAYLKPVANQTDHQAFAA